MDENKSLNPTDAEDATNSPESVAEESPIEASQPESVEVEASETENSVAETVAETIADEISENDVPSSKQEYPPKKEGGEYDERGYYIFPDGSYYDLLGDYHCVQGEQLSEATQAFTWEPINQDELLKPAVDKKKRHSAFKVSLIIMACVLSVALLILVAALIYNMIDTYPEAKDKNITVNVIVSDKGPTNPGDGYASPETLEKVKSSIVVISARSSEATSLGSGFIISTDGYIVTNQHVIEGTGEVWVDLYDGTSHKANVVGQSARDDIAVLKINAKDLPAITLAKSKDCYVGEIVYAIGSPDSYDYAWTVTMGIISHKSRNVKIYDNNGNLEKTMNLIQTDVSVNPGNSGGPIINTRGEVVGIITLKITNTEGMGFAIPIDGALQIIDALITKGNADDIESLVSPSRAMIGITCVGVMEGRYYIKTDTGVKEVEKDYADRHPSSSFYVPVGGIYVLGVDQKYNAVGVLEVGDIIVSIGGANVHDNNHFSFYLNKYKPGDRVELEVYRNGRYTTVYLTLAKEIKD